MDGGRRRRGRPPRAARRRGRPRARASASRSSTSTAAPSAITKPSRSAAKGRDAAPGSPVRAESAPIRWKPEVITGVTAASAPPATAMSHRPARSRWRAVASALAPDAHAVSVAREGPWAPRSNSTSPAAMLGISMGTSAGRPARDRLGDGGGSAPPGAPLRRARNRSRRRRGYRPTGRGRGRLSATASRAASTAKPAEVTHAPGLAAADSGLLRSHGRDAAG